MRYLVVILALIGVFFTGCEKVQKNLKDKQAEWMGLERTVSVYSLDGKLVKEYSGDINVDTTVQGRIYFILDDGKSVMTNMPYIVEEK